MLISKYIVAIFLSFSVIKSFRGMGVGGQGPPRFWNLTFSHQFFCKKSCFPSFEWQKWNFATFSPLQIYFCPTLDITVGAGKFLGVRRIFARSPPNLPEKFVRDFYWFFRDFAHISANQNIWGALSPLHPHLLHHCPWKFYFWSLSWKNPSGAHV